MKFYSRDISGSKFVGVTGVGDPSTWRTVLCFDKTDLLWSSESAELLVSVQIAVKLNNEVYAIGSYGRNVGSDTLAICKNGAPWIDTGLATYSSAMAIRCLSNQDIEIAIQTSNTKYRRSTIDSILHAPDISIPLIIDDGHPSTGIRQFDKNGSIVWNNQPNVDGQYVYEVIDGIKYVLIMKYGDWTLGQVDGSYTGAYNYKTKKHYRVSSIEARNPRLAVYNDIAIASGFKDNEDFTSNSPSWEVMNPIPIPVPGVKPAVTVVNWTLDELKNSREFRFIDRNNPGYGARVWVNNKSMYAELTNPYGSAQTGMVRPVKDCPVVPIPPTPIPPTPIPPNPFISKVRVDGEVFRTKDNKIFSWKGITSFLLLRELLMGNGATVGDYCSKVAALGYNVLRVFSQVKWNGSPGPGFIAKDFPNYFQVVDRLFTIANSYNLYIELVAHTFDYDLDEMATHVNRLHEVLKNHNNVFLELTNEPDVNSIHLDELLNRIDTSQFNYPWATGKYEPTAMPAGSYVTAHTPRDNEWPRKAKDLYEYRNGGGPNNPSDPAMKRPIVGDEPIGADETNQPGRRSNVPIDFYYYGALSQLLGAGATFHYQQGLNSVFPTNIQLACAKEFHRGISAVNPEFQLGHYTRVGLGDCPITEDSSLRTYVMILGNKAIAVRVRPTGQFKVSDEWKIINDNIFVIELERR